MNKQASSTWCEGYVLLDTATLIALRIKQIHKVQ